MANSNPLTPPSIAESLSKLKKDDLLDEAISMKKTIDTNKILQPMIECLIDKVIAISNHVSTLTKLVTDIHKDNAKINHQINKTKVDNEKIKKKNKDLENKIYYMQQDISKMDQYSRRQNVELSGIPNSVEDTNLEKIVLEILNKIGVKLNSYDIVAIHRLKIRRGQRSPNVIIRFLNSKHPYESLKKKKNLSKVEEYGKLYLTENLCPNYQSIFNHCMSLKKYGDLSKVWSYNGVVNVKFEDNDNEIPTKLYHKDDIDTYFYDDDSEHDSIITDFDEYATGWSKQGNPWGD